MTPLETSRDLVQRAVARDPGAVRALVRELSPVIEWRVTRALGRSRTGRAQGRSAEQETEDLTQEVFLALFDHDARALRSWDPTRGASLTTFVGLVAEHQVSSILRSGRRSPWREGQDIAEPDFERVPAHAGAPEMEVSSRELGVRLLDGLRAELTPRGLDLFHQLLVEEQPVESVCAKSGMTADAVYAWRSRLVKLVRRLAGELGLASGVSDAAPSPRKTEGEPTQ
ncbi:MAG TPA: sigma-70 family RNA polymerase sigma factor [Polyangiaceae bacterium]